MAKKKEELKNDESSNNGNNGGEGVTNPAGGQELGGESRPSGGEQGGEQGEQGGEQGGGGASQGGGESGDGGSRESSKIDLLQRIRAQRSNGLGLSSSNENGTSNGNREGNERGVRGSDGGAPDDNGATSRANRTNRRGGKQDSNGNGGTSEITQTNDSSGRISKPQGVDIKGVDKIKALAQKAAAVEPPKMKFTWDEKPLTNKESEEMFPKIKALLEFLFRHMDKGMSISNRARAESHVWSSIDQEDIEIIAGHLVEMGKASKVVATAVRRMTNSYRLLQIGLITLPKFIQTYQFYQANGGFALVGGK